jgi:hypothetical protein
MKDIIDRLEARYTYPFERRIILEHLELLKGSAYQNISGKELSDRVKHAYETLGITYNGYEGRTISVDPHFIAPDLRMGEWEDVDDEYIPDSSKNILVKVRYGILTVEDGHHRLKWALVEGKKNVKVDVI